MSINLSRSLTIAMIIAGIGVVVLPNESIARTSHRHGVTHPVLSYTPPNAFEQLAPPVIFYRTRPFSYYVGPSCDPARDWNC
jgi:hypothetical protein